MDMIQSGSTTVSQAREVSISLAEQKKKLMIMIINQSIRTDVRKYYNGKEEVMGVGWH